MLTDVPSSGTTRADRLRVVVEEVAYPAEAIAHGAAFEIFASDPARGFLDNPRPGARLRYRRFVPASEATVVAGPVPEPEETPLTAPLTRSLTWDAVQRLSQSPQTGRRELLAAVR